MGIETRIGIVAGLVIVVIASVYFFYGSNSEKDELFVAPGSKIADSAKGDRPLKIPMDGDKKAAPARVAGGKAPVAKPGHQQIKPPAVADRTPAGAVKPTAVPAATPSVAAGNRPANDLSRPAPSAVGPQQVPPPASPRIAKVDDRGPEPGGATAMVPEKLSPEPPRPALAHQTVTPVGGEPPKTTVLRTAPSQDLVDATRENIERAENRSATSAPDLAAVGQRLRQGAGDLLGGRKEEDRQQPPPAVSTDRDASKPGESAKPETPKTTPSQADWPKQHKIAAGDTLAVIAQHYYNDSARVADILAANSQIKDPRRLKIGETITLPAPKDSADGEKVEAKPSAPVAVEKPRVEQAAKTYQVKHGDTFFSIAKEVYGNGTRWKELYELNKETLKNDPKRLKPGMVIKLPE